MPPSYNSGYQRLAQDEDEILPISHSRSSTSSSQLGLLHRPRRLSRPELPKIDLNEVQHKFRAWLERIKSKKQISIERQEIAFSVFEPAFSRSNHPQAPVKTLLHEPPMTKPEFDELINSVKASILDGVHPKMISKGSSGSYFARVKEGDRHKIVGVFKPKDEEPYGRLNPKTTKWLHRKLRWIIPFGRSCLIPNLSYISEAAASLLDARLELNIVPRTELVALSSPTFYYDWIDRTASKNGKILPDKIGSFQCFMPGYTDASEFLREHPWPGRSISDTFDDTNHRTGGATKRIISALNLLCGRTGDDDLDEEDPEDEQTRELFDTAHPDNFYWSLTLQQDFRLELEKLIILDFIMRNTDRGSDNYMIKYCKAKHEKTIVNKAPTMTSTPLYTTMMSEVGRHDLAPNSSSSTPNPRTPPTPSVGPDGGVYARPHMHIAAIDNSLSFPHQHPRGWRSFTYGWLYLPVSLIGRPFSEQTRRHFLPLLSSKSWWQETTYELQKLFAQDPDFHPKMFARQMAVIKGQAWNVLQSLKHPDEGPLELTRRAKVLVWNDELEVDESFSADAILGPLSAGASSPSFSNPFSRGSPKRARRGRSTSIGHIRSEFPPAIGRTSSDLTGIARPVPLSSTFAKVHPGATGVAVLEQLERLDKVDERQVPDDNILIEEDEEDEDDTILQFSGPSKRNDNGNPGVDPITPGDIAQSTVAPSTSTEVPTVQKEATSKPSIRMSEEVTRGSHPRWTNERRGGRSLDVFRTPARSTKKTVIAERVETVDAKAFFSCW